MQTDYVAMLSLFVISNISYPLSISPGGCSAKVKEPSASRALRDWSGIVRAHPALPKAAVQTFPRSVGTSAE